MAENQTYYLVADGTKLKQGNTIFARIRALTPMSDTRQKIDVTSLDNAGVKTFLVSNIAEIGDVTLTIGMKDAYLLEPGNKEWTIEYPDGSTSKFWGSLLSRTPSQLVVSGEALCDAVIGVTNLNGTEQETAPTWPGQAEPAPAQTQG